MTPRLQELLDIASEALLPLPELGLLTWLTSDDRVDATELEELLSVKNGFYAFDSALLVRPLSCAGAPLGISEWNEPELWKYEYGSSLDGLLCFAEDVFGSQFALGREAIVAVDPETGELEPVSKTLDDWADMILGDINYRTGHSLALAWQAENGPLARGCRLVPKIPFVTGGQFVLGNLYSVSDVKGMRFRGSIARQIRDVPDGGHVVLKPRPNS
jgi:hypothetical protein